MTLRGKMQNGCCQCGRKTHKQIQMQNVLQQDPDKQNASALSEGESLMIAHRAAMDKNKNEEAYAQMMERWETLSMQLEEGQ